MADRLPEVGSVAWVSVPLVQGGGGDFFEERCLVRHESRMNGRERVGGRFDAVSGEAINWTPPPPTPSSHHPCPILRPVPPHEAAVECL